MMNMKKVIGKTFIRYRNIVKRSWLRSWMMARNGAKRGVFIVVFLMTLLSDYKKQRPQTDYLKIRADVEVHPNGDVERPPNGILYPEAILSLARLEKRGSDSNESLQGRFGTIVSAVALKNPVRALRMRTEMDEAYAVKEKAEATIAQKNSQYSTRANEADQAKDIIKDITTKNRAKWLQEVMSGQTLRYVAITILTMIESLLMFLTFSNIIGKQSKTELFGLLRGREVSIFSLSVVCTAVMAFFSHKAISMSESLFNGLSAKGKTTVKIVLTALSVLVLVVISMDLGLSRAQSMVNPLQWNPDSTFNNKAGDLTQQILILLLALCLGFLWNSAIEQMRKGKEQQKVDTPVNRPPLVRNAEIQTLENEIASLEAIRIRADEKIGSLIAEAEQEFEVTREKVEGEEKLLNGYLDEVYSALMADRFLFINLALKFGKPELILGQGFLSTEKSNEPALKMAEVRNSGKWRKNL